MTQMLSIIEAGLHTTVQDLGRYGYQRFGVPVSGAMDSFAFKTANALIGNSETAAGLEITALGPKIEFLEDTRIAITGANLGPLIDGEPIELWASVKVERGSVLTFSGPVEGLRAWLSVLGGIDVPLVMGSRSTYVKGEIGGFGGRALLPGDTVSTFDLEQDQDPEIYLPQDFDIPRYTGEFELRVVMGPQDEAFTEAAIDGLFTSTYTVSMDQDRMGCRLEGPLLEHLESPDIISDGSPLGALQVSGDGMPIVLLNDRGTTGGYTKIANVVGVDVGLLAQAMAGDAVRFTKVSVNHAHALLRQQHAMLASISQEADIQLSRPKLHIRADGFPVEVLDESGSPLTLAESEGPSTMILGKATIKEELHEFELEIHEKSE